MKRVLIAATALALSACATGSVSTPPNLDAVADAAAFRARHGLAFPITRPAVYVQSVSRHHYGYLHSTVAIRDDRGVWTISVAGERTSGLLRVDPPELVPEQTRRLTPEQGRALDRLLASDDLYSEPRNVTGTPSVGGATHMMVMVGPRRQTKVSWSMRLVGRKGEVADLVLGRG